MAEINDSVKTDDDGTPMLRLTKGRTAALQAALKIALESGQLYKGQSGVVRGLQKLFENVSDGHSVDKVVERTFYVAHYPDTAGETKIGYTNSLSSRRSRNTDNSKKLIDVATWTMPNKQAALDVETAMRKRHANAHIRGDWFALPTSAVVLAVAEIIGRDAEETGSE